MSLNRVRGEAEQVARQDGLLRRRSLRASPLKIGRILADSGAEVRLFADLEGSRLGDSRAPQSLVWGSGKSINELYDAFIKAGGSIVLCPHCASVAGIDEDSLRKGSRIVTEQEIAALFLDADKVIDF